MFTISALPDDLKVVGTLVQWSLNVWGSFFPNDSIDTYLDLYRSTLCPINTLPQVFVARNDAQQPIGTITLVDNDDLHHAYEPEPWRAALFVDQEVTVMQRTL